jgi:hypothetical protein
MVKSNALGGNCRGHFAICRARPESIAALPLVCPARSTNLLRLNVKFDGGEGMGVLAMRRTIDDYHSLLAKAVSALESDTAKARQEVYDRARAALKAEFGKFDPPPLDADFFEERLKLDVAIFDFEWSSATEITYAKSA